MTKQFKSSEIESAINQLMQTKNSVITVESLCEFLGASESDSELKERLLHYLIGDEALFSVDDEHFRCRNDFFNDKVFVVVPTAREIKEKILFIGHRFQTFMNPDVFPSDLTVKSGRKNIAVKVISDTLQELFPYHMLMGAEQISDFFIGEDENNAHWKTKGGYAAKIRLNVLDMSEFYTAQEMQYGDALVFTVSNYDKGVFKVAKLEKDERNAEKIAEWCKKFEEKIGDIADKFETYLDLPEQLRMAFFFAENEFFGKEGASLDEFIQRAENVEIIFDSDHTVLVRKTDEFSSSADTSAVPDGISISGGESSSLKAVLKAIGSTLTETEIDSYMLESCFDRNKDFTEFLNKVFDFSKLNFADEAQKTVFLNFLEERFEYLSENYSRYNDEEKAPLRSRILELVTSRVEFFDYIKTLEIDEKSIPQAEMKKIASGSLHLNQLLDMLNDEGQELTEDSKDAIFEALENTEDIFNDAMEAIETKLKI